MTNQATLTAKPASAFDAVDPSSQPALGRCASQSDACLHKEDMWLLTLRPLLSIYESSSPQCWGCRK